MKNILNLFDCPNTSAYKPYDFSVFDGIENKRLKLGIMLIMLQEIGGLVYKSECAMNEYCIDSFAKACTHYQKQAKVLRDKIVFDWSGEDG